MNLFIESNSLGYKNVKVSQKDYLIIILLVSLESPV